MTYWSCEIYSLIGILISLLLTVHDCVAYENLVISTICFALWLIRLSSILLPMSWCESSHALVLYPLLTMSNYLNLDLVLPALHWTMSFFHHSESLATFFLSVCVLYSSLAGLQQSLVHHDLLLLFATFWHPVHGFGNCLLVWWLIGLHMSSKSLSSNSQNFSVISDSCPSHHLFVSYMVMLWLPHGSSDAAKMEHIQLGANANIPISHISGWDSVIHSNKAYVSSVWVAE